MIHYAPYGKNMRGQFDCGASEGGYTGEASRVTCAACKAKSPGLWPQQTMTTAEAFLADICANPADDDLRLIFADWLEENGQYWLARFIRVSIAKGHDNAQGEYAKVNEAVAPSEEYSLWGLPAGWTVTCYRKLFELRRDLIAEGRITQQIAPGTALVTRGFVGEIACSENEFLQHCAAIFRAAPIEEVTLTGKEPMDINFDGTVWSWFDAAEWNESGQPEDLDTELFAALTGGWRDYNVEHKNREYPSRDAANFALSRAAVSLARQRAGLPTLEE